MLPLTEVDLHSITISIADVLRTAIVAIDRNQRGIAIVVDDGGRLVGTITDGDVRRAMLAGKGLDTSVEQLLVEKADSPYPSPVTARVGTDPSVLLQMMHDKVIRQIPLVDEHNKPVGVVTVDELIPDGPLTVEAIIMAGGYGTRLMPLTSDTPKPMLPVGDRPLIEIIVEQLRHAGIRQVNIATHYHSEKIKSHFGDGRNHGVVVSYVDEDQPLGTAGALGLLAVSKQPLLVINGDILTDVDFRAMLQFHREHRAELTMAVRKYEVDVPYGVVECDVASVLRLTEKPRFSFFVNAGIYLLEPSVQELIPAGKPANMTDIIHRLVELKRPVVSFPVREYWLDVGQRADYERAQSYATRDRNP